MSLLIIPTPAPTAQRTKEQAVTLGLSVLGPAALTHVEEPTELWQNDSSCFPIPVISEGS